MWGVYDRMMHFTSINVQGLMKKDQDQINISRYITMYKVTALINKLLQVQTYLPFKSSLFRDVTR